MNLEKFDLQAFVLQMAVLIIAITIHEFSHAITADRLGDPTPRSQGRISLFPTDHLTFFGTLMMVITSITGYGIGWGKPVMTNPRNFDSPRLFSGYVAIAGPISNILQAIVFAILFRVFHNASGPVAYFILMGVVVNISLACFNMIPIGPLDGHWVIQALLPRDLANKYEEVNNAYGQMVFLGLVLMAPGLLSSIITPPVAYVCSHLLGVNF